MANQDKKSLSGRTILLVDDDPLISRMYEQMLARAGANVILASNGAEGLEKLKENKVDLVLLDIMMPKLNGVEMLKILKSDERTKSIPVIILTNLGDKEEDIDNAKKLGALDYLVKSKISLKNLESIIVKCFE